MTSTVCNFYSLIYHAFLKSLVCKLQIESKTKSLFLFLLALVCLFPVLLICMSQVTLLVKCV